MQSHQHKHPQLRARTRETDSDLAKLIDTWPILPEPLKAVIRAMVEAARVSG